VSDDFGASSTCIVAAAPVSEIDDPFGPLPQLSRRQVRLDASLSRLGTDGAVSRALKWFGDSVGECVEFGAPETLWRPAGRSRGGVVAHLVWPRLATRLAVGVETPLAHALVDRLLGYHRLPEEGPRQVSPVEWGILMMVAAQTLRRLIAAGAGVLGPWDLLIDRVGPDAFDTNGLGRVVTIRWPLRIGAVAGSLRLWLPESVVARALDCHAPVPPSPEGVASTGMRNLAGIWLAEAGTITLRHGIASLSNGETLLFDQTELRGGPANLHGLVTLSLTMSDHDGTFVIPTEPVPDSAGGRLVIRSVLQHLATPREALAMNPADASARPASDVPVTLVVELGRLNLTLARLADLKPGDVVELGRHAREPVELTSAGRLVARGELVQVDAELGVRVTSVFL
jgi:flagellar motor switch protein FliN